MGFDEKYSTSHTTEHQILHEADMTLKSGDAAPFFSLEDHNGSTVTLDRFRGKRLVLYFTRYVGCPVCRMQLSTLSARYGEFEDMDVEVAVITQSSVERLNGFAEKTPIGFVLLSDPERQSYRDYDIKYGLSGMLSPRNIMPILRSVKAGYRHGPFEGNEFQYPAQFIIDEKGMIQFVYYGKTVSDALSVDTLLEELRKTA